MKLKGEKGVTGIDVTIGLILFLIGTTAVLNMYLQIYKNSTMLKINETILGYVTEIFEEIDLENYDDITNQRVEEIINAANIPSQYTITKTITKYKDLVENKTDEKVNDYVKKITLNIQYSIDNVQRDFDISKVKVREKQERVKV